MATNNQRISSPNVLGEEHSQPSSALYGSGESLFLADWVKRSSCPLLIIAPDVGTAGRIEQELQFFLDGSIQVVHFPDWETLAYDVFSPLPEIVSERLRALYVIPDLRRGAIIITVGGLMQRLAPRTHVLAGSFSIGIGSRVDLTAIRTRLESVGYLCVSQVMQHGEFSVRGSILDLFPMGSSVPFRIELFDDEVESIRTFDSETQRSLEKIERIDLFPAREFPFTEETIKTFRRTFRGQFPESHQRCQLYQDISKGIAPGGIEYYFPLFTETTETFFDYLPTGTTLIFLNGTESAVAAFNNEVQARFEQRGTNVDRPPLPPTALFLSPSELAQLATGFKGLNLHQETSKSFALESRALPNLAVGTRDKAGLEPLRTFLNTDPKLRCLFVAESPGYRETLIDLLAQIGVRPELVEGWTGFQNGTMARAITIGPLDRGYWSPSLEVAIITETELSGGRVKQERRRRASASRTLENIVQNLEELEVGAPVVHQEHGVGRYLGLQRLTVGGLDQEFLVLEYADRNKLYVPVASLGLIGRYSGGPPEAAPLHKLGSDQWAKAKRKAIERLRDVAAELLDIHAKRAAKIGLQYQTATEDYAAFAAGFPFEETPDQDAAIRDTLSDLAAPRPMDRVICGDVGFGKTEVAMRAAFVAAQNGRQVAVLVPTTLLAQQHYQNFRDRFADSAIRVEVISRFKQKGEQTGTLKAVAEGHVDIIIGTHRLLQKDITFKRLGLVIIDEEHRFGVAQKEHFKKLRAEVDVLTLTATPIPRTLNMALSGLRDISIIASPPPNRHPVKTFITEWDDALIQEACQREIRRGGQIYFLHNVIDTMEKMSRELIRLVPEARVEIAHGQMPERELERIMLDFYHQRFNLLLCSTIIESGIDVPSANTIIINRADRLGLAQLHQLRGRVGRSHHRAYAYMVTPPRALVTADAVKRLEAIDASGELGAGFLLSTHDLEIRGAGELLGDEQSGQIQEIGLTLYTELLERAVAAMRAGQVPDLETTAEAGEEIELQVPALIPDDYLPDVHSRLVLYKRLASVESEQELHQLKVEMIDRFGLLPDSTKNLFRSTELRLKMRRVGVKKIELGAGGGRVAFVAQPPFDPMALVSLVQGNPKQFRFDGPEKLRILQAFESAEAKFAAIEKLLETLAAGLPTAS